MHNGHLQRTTLQRTLKRRSDHQALLVSVLRHALGVLGCLSGLCVWVLCQDGPVLDAGVRVPFKFVAYGDTRFTDPKNTTDADPAVRQALVRAIAGAKPAFIAFGGDIPLDGSNENDWLVYDSETSVWRERHIPVFPAIGNHELKGDQAAGIGHFFKRFPALGGQRYYSLRAANTLFLFLDSSMEETTGHRALG